MAGDLIYAYRVLQLPLLDADGAYIGRIEDILLTSGRRGEPPIVLGFVATAQRRRIFVNAARVASLESEGARLRSWDVDLNPFKQREGELLVSKDLLDKRISDETVSDIALRPTPDKASTWAVAKVRLAKRTTLRRRPSYRVVDWDEVPQLFATSEVAAEAARLRDMHPTDVAQLVRNLPLAQRAQLAEAMEDERLADLLEELPEAEQLRMIEGLDLDRLVGVLEEMEYDDAADLLAEMTGERRTQVLAAMDEDDAGTLRRLLSYGEGTAGGLMNPDVIILGPTATVAEALARIREPEWLVSVAAQVFVTQPPWVPPTGRFLGVAHFQRLLREAPGLELSRCIEQQPGVPPDTDRARGRGAPGRLQPPRPPGVRRAATAARRDHGGRRARPHAAGRLAAAPAADRQSRREAPRGPHDAPPRPPVGHRRALRPRRIRRVLRGHRPHHRHRPLPRIAVGRHRDVDRLERAHPWPPPVRPVRPFSLCCSPSSSRCKPHTPRPLILLAQNRQEERDRTQLEFDRNIYERTKFGHGVPGQGDRRHPPGHGRRRDERGPRRSHRAAHQGA